MDLAIGGGSHCDDQESNPDRSGTVDPRAVDAATASSTGTETRYYTVNTKHMYNICTTLDQRRRRWADVVQMLYKCFVFTGLGLVRLADLWRCALIN